MLSLLSSLSIFIVTGNLQRNPIKVIMDQVCPRCKTTKYRNPNMRLMVNVCGHNICETCVELLFVKVNILHLIILSSNVNPLSG